MEGTWKDDRTLDEMATTDAEMLERCYKQSDSFDFRSVRECQRFIAECMKATLSKFGVDLSAGADPNEVDAAMKKNGVKVEHRTKYPPAEAWKAGIYIYKNSELVAFISHPAVREKQKLISLTGQTTNPAHAPFHVRTNCKVIASRLII